MKKLTNILTLLLISSVLTGIFISCEGPAGPKGDKGNPDTRYFTFYFNVNKTYGTNDFHIDVNFTSSDLSAIPSVVVNGVAMENFSVGGWGGIFGHIENLQYSTTVNYSVSASGETTTGSIDVPSNPSDVMCNGIQVFEDSVNNIPYSNSFSFSWQCSDYDYFDIYWYNESNDDNEYITERNYSFDSDSGDYFSFSLLPVNGVMPVSGAAPNVSGEYGYGYVWAEADYFYINWYYFTDSIQKRPSVIEDERARVNYYRQKFIELISGK